MEKHILMQLTLAYKDEWVKNIRLKFQNQFSLINNTCSYIIRERASVEEGKVTMVTAKRLQNIFTIFLFYLLIYRFVSFLTYLFIIKYAN